MKDRITTGVLFALLFIGNTLLVFFLTQYERTSGSIVLGRIYWVFFCTNAGYVIYYWIVKWRDDFSSFKKNDLPMFIIATVPNVLQLLATIAKCSLSVRVIIGILWGIISALQIITFIVRVLKYDNSWNFIRLFKQKQD